MDNELRTWKEINSSGIDGYSNYMGNTEHENMYVLLSRSRDADVLTESNFQTAIDRLGGESKTVQILRFNHWACGWFEQILIDGKDTIAMDIANQIKIDIENYPVLDDQDYYEREYTRAKECWEYMRHSDKVDYCKRYNIDGRQANRKVVPDDLISVLAE